MTIKYYAAEPDRVAQNPIENGIEITQEQYLAAITGLTSVENPKRISTLNGEFSLIDPPVETPEEPEEPEVDLYAYSAQKRWEREVSGTTLMGLTIATDDRSKILISGARQAADNDPDFTTQWKLPDGTFITLDADMIIAISDAALGHVASCFALEEQVNIQIANETITTKEQVDQAYGS